MAVELKGADKLRKALREFEPDLAKSTTKEMTRVLKPLTNKARGYMPADDSQLSGWTKASSSAETTNYRHFPKYDQAEAKRGVKYSTSPSKPNHKGFVALARLINSSAGGAIYETSGRKNPNGQPSQASTRGKYSSYIDTSNKVNKSLNPNAGKQFIARANQLGKLVDARPQGQVGRATRKMTGRVIFRAFDEDQGRVTAAVVKAIESSARQFEARTDGK